MLRACVFLTGFLVLVGAGGVARAEDLTVTIDRYEAWRGDAAFKGLAGLHAMGALSTGGLSGTVETWSTRDGKVRQDVDLGAFKQSQAARGPDGWTTDLGGKPQKLSPAEAADAVQDGEILYDGLFHGADGAVLSAQPPESFDGAPVAVARISQGDGNRHDFLISPGDGRLLAIRSLVNGQTLLSRFADWRMVDGVRMPFREDVTGEKPSDASSTVYRSIEINPPIPDSLFAPPAAVKRITFADGANSSGWLPFEFFNRTRIFIPAAINGHATTVMLDSGASATVLDRRFVQSLGLKAEGDLTAQGAGGSSTLGIVHGVDLALGALTLRDVTAVAIDAAAVEKQLGHPLPVVLGGEAFTDCVVDIDFRRHRIAFRDPAAFSPPADAHAVAAIESNGIRTIDGSVEGRPATLEFDIGNGSALSLFPRFWEQPGFMTGRRASTTLGGGLGGVNVRKLAMMRDIAVGATTFGHVPASLESTNSAASRSGRLDGNIGLPVLSRFRLIVDFPHDRVVFAPPVDAATPFDVNHSGLTLQPAADGEKILYVAPDSPGAAAGLKADDTIAAIDGAPARASGDWRYGAPGQTLSIRLTDGREMKLTLAAYF